MTNASEDTQDSFISHLVELRSRLMKAVASVLVVAIALFIWPGSDTIYNLLARPMLEALPQGSHMVAIGITTTFIIPLKVTLLVALVISLPFVLYQIWAFVAPGLYRNEQRLALPLIVSSTLLFLLGMAFCYFVVFHTVFRFFARIAPSSIEMMPDIEHYVNFVLTLFLAFGAAFEVPIAVVLLVKTGMVTVAKLREVRGYVIVGCFVVAAVITPPDVLSQLMLATPLCLLYEIGIITSAILEKRKKETDDADAARELVANDQDPPSDGPAEP
ncbi:MAG TPA: twin-arginine translocase subunit TatC [Castellaniella sp.]|uniref:twin-arginine translocase subunit TatC n=1 Tax=Castellaniella sp. TaxID=1955812 RepID=UPI002F143D2D